MSIRQYAMVCCATNATAASPDIALSVCHTVSTFPCHLTPRRTGINRLRPVTMSSKLNIVSKLRDLSEVPACFPCINTLQLFGCVIFKAKFCTIITSDCFALHFYIFVSFILNHVFILTFQIILIYLLLLYSWSSTCLYVQDIIVLMLRSTLFTRDIYMEQYYYWASTTPN